MNYILVHGTFDTDESLEGDRWWQKGSDFYRELEERIGPDDEIIQFRWSGENSDYSRIIAGRELEKRSRV